MTFLSHHQLLSNPCSLWDTSVSRKDVLNCFFYTVKMMFYKNFKDQVGGNRKNIENSLIVLYEDYMIIDLVHIDSYIIK
jgi:hypothetical protein